MKKQLLFATSVLAAAAVNAQTETIDSLRKNQQTLQPVEVRAVRITNVSPFAKTDVKGTDIEKVNVGQDLPYLLQYTPSAVVTSDAGAGVGYTGLRVRGTDGIRMNVTLNGFPVNDAESQGTFFVNFGDVASSVSSIQLQRGVGTSTNGGAAFGATMSISNLGQFEKAGAEISNSYGSFNTWKHTLKAGTGLLTNGLQFDLRLSKISSDGYVDRSYSDLKSAQFIAGWKGDKTSLKFMLMTGTEKTGQAWNGVPEDSLATNRQFNGLGLKSDGTYYDNQTDNYQQDYYQLFADHQFSNYLTGHLGLFLTRGKGYYEEYKMGESFSKYGLNDFITPSNDTFSSTDLIRQLWLDNYYYGTVFSFLYSKDKTQVTFGGGWTQYLGDHYGYVNWAQYGVPDHYRWYLLDAQKDDLNFYAKLQQGVGEKVTLFGDLQYRTVSYDINGFRDNPALKPSVQYNFFNPKAGITYMLRNTYAQRQKLYASIAVANKEPNRSDFETSPTAEPKHEQLYDAEAGYEINRKKWSAGANLYYMMYKDQLILTGQINDVGAYVRTNVPESYRAGIELQGAVLPTWWMKLHGNATFSQNKINDFTEYIDNYDDANGEQLVVDHGTTDIAFSPNLVAAAGITLSPFRYMSYGQNLELDIMGKHVGQQYLDNTGNSDRSIAAYTLCDVRLRYSIRVKPFRELAATLALNNVLNTMYESNGYTFSYQYSGALTTENFYYPQAGFNWLLGVTMKW